MFHPEQVAAAHPVNEVVYAICAKPGAESQRAVRIKSERHHGVDLVRSNKGVLQCMLRKGLGDWIRDLMA